MGTTRLGIFPSLNNKVMYDKLDKGLAEWFLARFPNDFFSHVFIENQSNNSNNYKLNPNGELIPINSSQVMVTPYIRFSFKHSGNNMSDVFGTDIWNPNQQPGAFAVDTDLTGYRPIYMDPFHCIIALNERTIRTQFEIIMRIQNKSDQLGLYNYLDTFIKSNYVQTVDLPTTIPMHNVLMEYLRSSIFKPEMIALDKMINDSPEKLKFKQKINEMFMSLMYDHSEGHIKPYKLTKESTDSDGNKIDTKNYSFCYNQINRLYVKFEKPEGDEGDKKGNAYNSFTISISGNYDFGVPISFITSVPAIIRGTRNNWYMKTSNNTNRERYYHMVQFKEVFKDNRHLKAIDPNTYQHFYFEKEIMMSAKEEYFNIIDDVIDLEESPTHYYIMKAILATITSKHEFDEMFKVVIYKDDDFINPKKYQIDEKFNISLHDCDLSVPYYIDVFINRGLYINALNDIRTELENAGINWWKYFDKIIENSDNLGWFINTIKKDFRSYFVEKNYQPNDSKKYILNPYEPNSHVERGYQGIGYIPQVVITEAEDEDFVPIVYSNFLICDPNYQYYIKNKSGNFITISAEDVERSINEIFVYIKVGENYVECDPNKIMIADPKYYYFTFDKEKNKFVYQKKLVYFDKLTQYYILKEQYSYFIPNVEKF